MGREMNKILKIWFYNKTQKYNEQEEKEITYSCNIYFEYKVIQAGGGTNIKSDDQTLPSENQLGYSNEIFSFVQTKGNGNWEYTKNLLIVDGLATKDYDA